MISPRLSKVVSGTRLTTDLLNSMIKRTEYAADLLRQYKLIAGNQMYIEPHYDGTRVSYLQPLYNDGSDPNNPLTEAEVLDRFTEENNEAGNIVFPDPFNIYLDFLGINGYWYADEFFYTRGGPDPEGQTLTFALSLSFDNPYRSLGYTHQAFTLAPMTAIVGGPPYTIDLPTKLLFVPGAFRFPP